MAAPKPEDRFAEQFDRAREFFEPQLHALGLGVDDINRQSLDELHQSLAKINDAIAHPDSFGTLKISTKVGVIIATPEVHIEIGILPVLLERKQLILQRIAELRGDQKIANLRDLVAQISDEELKSVLETEIADLEASKQYQEQAAQVQIERDSVVARIEEERLRMQLELEKFERKSQVWRAFLERESVATIIGAMLLLILAVVLAVAMFTSVAVSAVISNSFLLILGYFFGQTATRGSARGTP